MIAFFRRWTGAQDGTAVVEYALLVAFVAVTAAVTLKSDSGALAAVFARVAAALSHGVFLAILTGA
jgi:Flp pilus assembly pilin Flp